MSKPWTWAFPYAALLSLWAKRIRSGAPGASSLTSFSPGSPFAPCHGRQRSRDDDQKRSATTGLEPVSRLNNPAYTENVDSLNHRPGAHRKGLKRPSGGCLSTAVPMATLPGKEDRPPPPHRNKSRLRRKTAGQIASSKCGSFAGRWQDAEGQHKRKGKTPHHSASCLRPRNQTPQHVLIPALVESRLKPAENMEPRHRESVNGAAEGGGTPGERGRRKVAARSLSQNRECAPASYGVQRWNLWCAGVQGVCGPARYKDTLISSPADKKVHLAYRCFHNNPLPKRSERHEIEKRNVGCTTEKRPRDLSLKAPATAKLSSNQTALQKIPSLTAGAISPRRQAVKPSR